MREDRYSVYTDIVTRVWRGVYSLENGVLETRKCNQTYCVNLITRHIKFDVSAYTLV